MKKFFAFLKWHYKQWSPTQLIWLVGCVFFGAGVPDYIKTGVPGDALVVTMVCWVTVLVKWFVWDMFWESWAKYKQARNELFQTIKTSEVKE